MGLQDLIVFLIVGALSSFWIFRLGRKPVLKSMAKYYLKKNKIKKATAVYAQALKENPASCGGCASCPSSSSADATSSLQ